MENWNISKALRRTKKLKLDFSWWIDVGNRILNLISCVIIESIIVLACDVARFWLFIVFRLPFCLNFFPGKIKGKQKKNINVRNKKIVSRIIFPFPSFCYEKETNCSLEITWKKSQRKQTIATRLNEEILRSLVMKIKSLKRAFLSSSFRLFYVFYQLKIFFVSREFCYRIDRWSFSSLFLWSLKKIIWNFNLM